MGYDTNDGSELKRAVARAQAKSETVRKLFFDMMERASFHPRLRRARNEKARQAEDAEEKLAEVEAALAQWTHERRVMSHDLEEGESWACTSCTFINPHSKRLECEVCTQVRC
jgi:hypothetical protein